MTAINFVVGLTDVEDYDGFIYGDVGSESPNRDKVVYNIKKASTDIEKASLSWSLDMTLDVTKNVIKVWEHIIRRPHLDMISMSVIKNAQAPEYNHYEFDVSFMHLIPMLSDYRVQLTHDDYKCIRENNEFGDMFLEILSLNQQSGIMYEDTLNYAYYHDTLDLLKEHTPPYIHPLFNFDFNMTPRVVNSPYRKHPYDFIGWVDKNKDSLAEKGYTLDMPYCNVGLFCIGKLIGDPWEEYQKLQKYSRICRTSMVVVEE